MFLNFNMTTIIDGKKIAGKIKSKIKQEIIKNNIQASLAVILVGENPASQIYVKNKIQTCHELGIISQSFELPAKTSEKELLTLIKKLNNDKKINGILVQLPLPDHINKSKIIKAILPDKDVDGFHPENTKRLHANKDCFVPCTPAGIMKLLQEYNIKIKNKQVVVVGDSDIVGKPIAELLKQAGATVTICNKQTKNISIFTKQADILVTATGVKNLIKKEILKSGVAVIDVGISRDENNKIFGDVDFKNVKNIASYITPVPGGVGPMTIAMLMNNCLKAYYLQNKQKSNLEIFRN